jgi:hypothetical protein
MLPNKSAFISYHTVTGQRVRMGNNSFATIAGYGATIISLNRKRFSFVTVFMSLTFGTHYTVYAPTNAREDVASLVCLVLGCMCSFQHLYWKWIPPRTVTCNMYPSDGVHASQTWIMSNLSRLQKHWLIQMRRRPNWLLPLPQSNLTMTWTTNLPLHLIGLNAPPHLSILLWICHFYLLPHIHRVSKNSK